MTADELRNSPVAVAIRRHRLVAVLRAVEPRGELLALVDDLADAGLRVFEVTLDIASGADDLRAVRERLRSRGGDAVVGAGTLTSVARLDAAIGAGADFGVAPIVDPELTRRAVAAGLPFVPAGMTPTEVSAAWEAGATFVKLFPASAVGPAFVRELRGPLPHVELLPTGGVDADSAAAFLEAGAVAVGIGSAITRATPEERRRLVRSLAARALAPNA